MGSDFEFIVTHKDAPRPNRDDYGDWWMIMSGSLQDGRNQWEGPVDGPYTKHEMRGLLKAYVNKSDGSEYSYRFTLRAFGEIISVLDGEENLVVYIWYG